MTEFKANIGNPKTGKTHKKDIVGAEADTLLHKKIGDKIKGDQIGFSGYEFQITGGSDSSGFPMRWDVSGAGRAKVLITSGVGTRHNRKGMRLRRTVVGNTIGPKTVQLNLKILKEGKEPLEAPAEPEAPVAEGEQATEATQSNEVASAPEAKPLSEPEEKTESKEETPKEEAKPEAEAPKEEAKEE